MPENPAEPLPLWFSWLGDTTPVDEVLGSYAEIELANDGSAGLSTLNTYLNLYPPAAAVRVEVSVSWSLTFGRTGGSNTTASTMSQSVGANTSITGASNFSQPTLPGSGAAVATVSNGYDSTYTKTAGATWQGNREAAEASPPTGQTSSAVRFRIALSDAGNATNYSYSSAYIRVTVTEIELSNGTIYSPPTTPLTLTATAISPTEIDLAWEDLGGGDDQGVRIERSPNGSTGWTQIDTVAEGVTTYSDTGLTPATTYYYRVRFFTNASYSNTANATTLSLDKYQIGDGHDTPANELVELTPQPQSSGVKVTRRPHSVSGGLQDEFLYLELVYSALGSVAEYQAVLTAFGVLNAIENQITITARDRTLVWTTFNGTAVRPQMGADVRWERHFPRQVVILVKDLEVAA